MSGDQTNGSGALLYLFGPPEIHESVSPVQDMEVNLGVDLKVRKCLKVDKLQQSFCLLSVVLQPLCSVP